MSFRQVDQRHLSTEIRLMEWSPTMDLIALVTVQGEVFLRRLSWQRVWALPSRSRKDREVNVKAVAWRPDGKVLAIAYDTIGNIFLVDVENSETIHLLEINGTVTALKWVENTTNNGPKPVFYCDNSSLFLPKYYSLVKNFPSTNKPGEENTDDSKRVKDQDCMNMLVVGTDSGKVHLYAFGMFHCGHVDIKKSESDKRDVTVISVTLSEDFSLLSMVLECAEEGEVFYRYKSFSLPLLKTKTEEFRVVALKYGQMAILLTFLSATIRAINEAWEDILLEIDTKLLKYAVEKKRVSDGTISDDFLELLIFGTPSDALEKFLLHDLTENGLKKFGHSIELSYSNIQKLVLKKLQNVASSLFYNLSDVKGIALWQERFGELGLCPEAVKAALSSVGSFLMKATEIQQVIDSSMKNFKAFFRWLYAVILRLSDEPIPAEITKVTQQDLNFVAEFLKENFTDEWNLNQKSTFKLERVGQYLKNEKLPFPPVVSGNPWITFLEKCPSLKDTDMIFPYHPEMSLVQQHHDVRKTIENAFSGPKNVFHKTVTERNDHVLFSHSYSIGMKVSHATSVKNGYALSVFTKDVAPVNYLYLLAESLTDKNDIRCLSLFFGELPSFAFDSSSSSPAACNNHKIFDVKFYNENTISILLIEDHHTSGKIDCPVLMQLPLANLCSELQPVTIAADGNICLNVPTINGAKYVDKAGHKRLENCKAVELAVSGSRKVACILFSSRRQVRLFEMEVDDDDDEPEETDHEESMKEWRDDPFISENAYESAINDNKENSP